MKKHLTIILSLIGPLSALAAYQGPLRNAWTFRPSLVWAQRWSYSSGANNWAHLIPNTYSGSWAFNEGVNNETAGGSATFTRGSNSGTTQIWLHNDVSGYVAMFINNGGADFTGSTTVTADDGVTISGSREAVFIADNWGGNDDNPNGRKVGNWTFNGGTYVGSGNYDGMYVRNVGTMRFDGTSFIAGSGGRYGAYIHDTSGVTILNSQENDVLYQAGNLSSGSGANVAGAAGLYVGGTANISGGYATFMGSQASRSTKLQANNTDDNTSGQVASAYGGAGIYVTGTTTLNGDNYSFIGGDSGNAVAGGDNSRAYASGGDGAAFGVLNGTISNATARGTSAGEAEIVKTTFLRDSETYEDSAANARAYAHGGSGLWAGSGSSFTLNDSKAYGGTGGSAIANETANYADASGGSGVSAAGSLTINGGHFQGGHAGSAVSREGEAYAIGGSGIYSLGTVTINDGTFIGGRGGTTNGVQDADGAGVWVSGGTLSINGGTFSGTGNQNKAIWAENSTLTITENSTNTTIGGNVYFSNAGKSFTLNGGTIDGDIYFGGTGASTFNVSSNATPISGAIVQDGGTLTINNEAGADGFFKKVYINGETTFNNALVAEASSFSLMNSDSTLNFAAGAQLNKGSRIAVGFGTLESGANLEMGENANVALSYNGLSGDMGSMNLGANSLVFSNATARLNIGGAAATPTGSEQFVAGGATTFATNADTQVQADLGWLVRTSVDGTSGVRVDWEYNSLTNTSLIDLGENILTNVDNEIVGLSSNDFYSLNVIGEPEVVQMARYSLSQVPEVADSTFQVQQQVSGQIAARGTEFRSMNGYASTKPRFGQSAPSGVAGPEGDMDGDWKVWLRGYGSIGDRDADGNFAQYDSTIWGTVVGLDKSFENLLIGIAGGYGNSDLDAGDVYDAETDTGHGSVYATIGGETVFVDLAATYALSKTEDTNAGSKDKFDSQSYSAYVGGGMTFDIKEKVALTPEASILATFYEQEAFTRTGLLIPGVMEVDDYDDESYLGSLGLNIATVHQIDWLNHNIALIPEVRAHWLHEFNDELDNGSYTITGTPGSLPLYIRPREEDLFRIGIGVDMWNWKYQRSKFEIDYDAIFADNYEAHTLSGKVSVSF